VRRSRDAEDAGGDPLPGAGFAMPVSLLAALVVSSPATLAALDGRLDAPVAMTAFVAALAAVWVVGAIGTWALSAFDGPARARRGTAGGGDPGGDATTDR
jgi:hypothetical protein